MSNKKVKVDNLAKAILKELDNFEGATEDACEKGVSETAKTALKALRSAHPKGSEGSQSGKYGSWDKSYNKGWTISQTKRDKEKHRKQIHNKTDYQLTHLLEKGHALHQGGRAQAFPHIGPVAEKCEDELVKNIRKHI